EVGAAGMAAVARPRPSGVSPRRGARPRAPPPFRRRGRRRRRRRRAGGRQVQERSRTVRRARGSRETDRLVVVSNQVVHSEPLRKNGGYHTNPASGEEAPSETPC